MKRAVAIGGEEVSEEAPGGLGQPPAPGPGSPRGARLVSPQPSRTYGKDPEGR